MYTTNEMCFPLFFSILSTLSNMHLEEISCLLEYHCNHSVCLRELVSLLYIEFIFSNDLLKQLAVALCNQQNFLLCGCHCYYGESWQKGSVSSCFFPLQGF